MLSIEFVSRCGNLGYGSVFDHVTWNTNRPKDWDKMSVRTFMAKSWNSWTPSRTRLIRSFTIAVSLLNVMLLSSDQPAGGLFNLSTTLEVVNSTSLIEGVGIARVDDATARRTTDRVLMINIIIADQSWRLQVFMEWEKSRTILGVWR